MNSRQRVRYNTAREAAKKESIMSMRVTKKQVEEAAKARDKALKENPDFRELLEQEQKEIRTAEREHQKEKG